MYPSELKYHKEHVWVKPEGANRVRTGITHHAQSELGDIVYFDMPEVGDEVEADDSYTTVESVKTVSDVYSAVSGTIVEVNDLLEDEPATMNEDPYGKGWICIVEVDDMSVLDNLLSADEYRKEVDG